VRTDWQALAFNLDLLPCMKWTCLVFLSHLFPPYDATIIEAPPEKVDICVHVNIQKKVIQ
jgi:hypothetical protein